MSAVIPDFKPGQPVSHPDLGEGVIAALSPGGYAAVFFKSVGQRQVPVETLRYQLTWEQRVLSGLRQVSPKNLELLWLALEAEQLPLMDSATTLTSAKVDLLPHQVVLVHRLATASPRRFLIADEVGLGKTVETALILRELASRGQMNRTLMIVPAGLVNNWARELNETFNLDFEIFGSEGDVTDRKSNAFAKHNRLIASIDTLKRPARVKRLLEAPPWDLVVFDEAHHLSAYKNGRRVKKTENYKLSEAIRGHCRDLLLLSATPHQGDHFRFWMLVRLLDPTLFQNEQEMVESRHRLNAVVVRRTKADACKADGSLIFARRFVNTQAFHLNEDELKFYTALQDYLRDGYNLAETQGGKNRALGFVMTIFQKIAASSFAAVKKTLRRRLLMLTIHEAIHCDQNMDVDGRNNALSEARTLIREMFNLPFDTMGRAEVERILADYRLRMLRKIQDAETFIYNYDLHGASDIATGTAEESAADFVSIALPEERRRIYSLLELCPNGVETKIIELLRALGEIWRINHNEKVVIFTTYLGSVDSIKEAIKDTFPGQGVEVLKGGDQGAKAAAEKRFKRPDGPKVLICTAAGREGINLQFSHILFNHDLPWNPMDLEQRIGRIHRYGQKSTAQVYNFVAADTIEGKIYLILEEKLKEIAKTLGKVDENGQVSEDLRSQILGQLFERLSYDRLYQDAVRDPALRRTRQEIEMAMENAARARNVVLELFQDLEGFNISDYQARDDKGAGMQRLIQFAATALRHKNGKLIEVEKDKTYIADMGNGQLIRFTTQRDIAIEDENLSLLGLEHPLIQQLLEEFTSLSPEARALRGKIPSLNNTGVLTIWRIEIQGAKGHLQRLILPLGVNSEGERTRSIEQAWTMLQQLQPSFGEGFTSDCLEHILLEVIPPMLQRELQHTGALPEGATFSASLLGLVELV